MGSEAVTAEKVKQEPLDALTYAKRFIAVIKGTATFDERSDATKVNAKAKTPFTFKVGDKVPATRTAIAVYNGLSYNSNLAREKTYRKEGMNLPELPNGKRGKSNDYTAINEALAEDAVADEMTED